MNELLLVGIIVLQGLTMWTLHKLVNLIGRMLCQQAAVFSAANDALQEAHRAVQP